MHRLQSKSIIARFRIAALLLCIKCLLIPVVAGVLIYSFVMDDLGLAVIGIALLALTVLVGVLQWLLAMRTRCPLCMTPVLAAKRCAKHRNARALFGSHRLRVALTILTKASFQCPYCHEESAMLVRIRGPQT